MERKEPEYTIVRDEGGMTVFPDTPHVRNFLTLEYREMVKMGRKVKFNTLVEPMYSMTSVPAANGKSKAALFSHQGFWRSLKEDLEAVGRKVTVQDVRPRVLENPNYAAALAGLRPFQKKWILDALRCGDSGLLGAPTRFGKSYGMTAIAKAFPNATIVVTAPGVDLCEQLHEHFKEILPNRPIKGVYTGSRNSKQCDARGGITICSLDSLHKMDPDNTDILILDEPHAVVSEERMPKVAAFTRSRKYGFGATLKGRFDKKDRLIEGLIGPVISDVTYLEAVEWGAISPLKVVFLTVEFSKDTVPGSWVDRDTVYKRLLTESSRTATLIRKVIHDVIPQDWQTMAFIKDESQAEFYMEKGILEPGTVEDEMRRWTEDAPHRRVAWEKAAPDREADWYKKEPNRKSAHKRAVKKAEKDEDAVKLKELGTYEPAPYVAQPFSDPVFDRTAALKKLCLGAAKTIAMAKRLTNKERKAATKAIVDGIVTRVLASNIYVQGLTFPDLKVVLNLAGGGANTTAIQKPGRLLQMRPGKNYGVMFDIMFKCRDEHEEHRRNPPYKGIVGEGWARHKAYEEIGYDIEFVSDAKRAREIVLGAYETES